MKKNCPGFSLIELLVSISVVAILSGIGLAAFSSFNRRQIVASATRQLLSDLRLAQSKADSSERTADCRGDLLGYKVVISPASYQYQISPDCTLQPPPAPTLAPIKTVSFSEVIQILPAQDTQIIFKTLRQGAESPSFDSDSKVTISLEAYGATRTVTVSRSGEIYTD